MTDFVADAGPGQPPDLALYVHWPYCARICPYCDFNVVRARGRADEDGALVRAILADLATQSKGLGPRRLVSIFFGGGTPSLMSPEAVATIVEAATRRFSPARDLEITLEANPTDAEAGRFEALARAGVERLSLGLQSLDDETLRFLGRNHDAAEARRAAATAAATFARVSVDLIYALPGQSALAWAAELERAVGLGAGHVSPYQLTIESGTAFHRAVTRGRFTPPEPDLAARLFDVTGTVLERAGFDAYEVSNHARGPGARSRHNLAVWRGVDYLGVGPGAHGRLTRGGIRHAARTAPRIADYIARVTETGSGVEADEPLSAREVAEERVMLGLRIAEGLPAAVLAGLGLTPDLRPLADLLDSGVLRLDGDRIAATTPGRLVLDRVISELLTA